MSNRQNNNPFIALRRLLRAMALCLLGALPFSTAAALDLDRKIDFNIPAQDLDAALIEFSRQTRLQVIVSDDIRGKTTPGITGKLPIKRALSQLLTAQGLSYQVASDSSVTVKKTAAPATSSSGNAVEALQLARADAVTAAEEERPSRASRT